MRQNSVSQPISFPKQTPIKSFQILETILESDYPIYKVTGKDKSKISVLKVFPYKNEKINKYYENEVKFMNLKHPNVINIFHKHDKEMLVKDDSTKYFSYIVMEYAPYGDLMTFAINHNIHQDQKLVRTYFHQLIEGLEYLHEQKLYHVDLKLENLLIGEDYLLKIIDFDTSFRAGDRTLIGRGTKGIRAPEIKMGCADHPEAADVYSAGIILFNLVLGHFPYSEEKFNPKFDDLWELMLCQDNRFWQKHESMTKDFDRLVSSDFKALFLSMTKYKPLERVSIREIKQNPWYCGPIYSKEELKVVMADAFSDDD